MPRQVPVRRVLATALLVPALGLTGCGAATTTVGPTGVDGLVIPTPSVDPDDFVTGIDHDMLTMTPGSSWTYQVSGRTASYTRTVEVDQRTRRVAGVEATVVRTRDRRRETVDLYAQDRRGNVWWLGRVGEWRAGVDGARAGLLLPAESRFGDGYRAAYVAGEVDERVSVVDVDATAEIDGATWGGLVVVEVTSPFRPGRVERRWYAEGAGLVRAALYRADPDRSAPVRLVELTGVD